MWIPDELEAMRRGGIIDSQGVELELEPGELIAPAEDLRRTIGDIDEWSRETETENLHHLAVVSAGRRNGKELEFQIAHAAAAAGLTTAEFEEALHRVGELITQAAAAAAEILDIVIQTITDAFTPCLADAWEEIQKLMEEYADVDEPEEEDRHDGAVEVLVTWLLPVPSLYELYGQGVDHGGPGPSRLTLTRVTDDGLRRAETGRNRKGEHAMIIFANVVLGIGAGVLFLGVIGEKDKEKHRDVTLCFIATLATIVLINVFA